MLARVKTSFSKRSLTQLVKSTVQISEFHKPTDIITHCPSIETRFPFHNAAFLFEHPVSPEKAIACHQKFQSLLHKASGAKVWTVREILRLAHHSDLRSALIRLSNITFNVYPSDFKRIDRTKLTSDYIDYSLSNLSKDDLISLILLNPSISIDVDQDFNGFHFENIPLSPLANLTFTRDQQITTAKGVVIGRFYAQQRKAENELMNYVWHLLGVNPIGRIKAPGTLEGGDFMPINKDYAMLGVGLRTNLAAAKQLMEEDLLGTPKFVVVEDIVDMDQQRMHLDTYFNVVSEKICLCVDAIAQDDPKYIRVVHEYEKDESGYHERLQMPFGKWLKKEGYEVVQATFKQQEEYFLNLVHLGKTSKGKDSVFAINPMVEREIRKHGFEGEVTYLDFSPITAMYGGAHCASQILREPQ